MAQPQKAISQAALEGCSALDFSGWFAPTSVKIMSYDISEGKVVTSQNVADLSSRVFTALPDLSDAYVLTRDAPTQLDDGEIILSPGSAASLCLHPIVEEPMRCVDNDDVGTWEVTPTAIDDNCLVLSFNQWYTEPSEHDWSVCAMPLAPLCRSVAHTGAFARSLRGCDFHSCPACVACMTQVSMICTHTRERIRARAHWHARIVTARATLCTSTQRVFLLPG